MMNTKDYMRQAIVAANALRVELGRRLVGSFTVAPHAGLNGGAVSIHLGDMQALQLAEMVKQNKSPCPARVAGAVLRPLRHG